MDVPIAFEFPAIPRTFPAMMYDQGNRLLDQLERRYGGLALPKILHWIVGFQILTFALSFVSKDFLLWIVYDRELILGGQVWRVITWVFFPVTLNVFFFICSSMFMLFVSNSLENEWGSFRLNVYVFASMIGLALIGLLPLVGTFGLFFGMVFFSSAFLAFATIFPEQIINLFGVIPIKAKWLGWVDAAGLAAFVLAGPAPILAGFVVLVGMLPYFLTFAPGFIASQRRQSVAKVRRHKFEADTAGGDAFHECATCGATERTHPTREFRVAADGEEYCDSCRKPG